MGELDVTTVEAEQLSTSFNAWAANSTVNVLEELRTAGGNRYFVANRLKPLITEPRISITRKGQDPVQLDNVTNYIGFTNKKDPIPIDDDDERRFFVHFVNFTKVDDFVKHASNGTLGRVDYYNRLFATLKNHPLQLKKWLLDYPISEEFSRMQTAPETLAKKSMQEAEKAKNTGLPEAIRILERGGKYLSNEIFATKYLFVELSKYPELENEFYSPKDKNLLLRKLENYSELPKKINCKGEVLRFYAKRLDWKNKDVLDYFKEYNKTAPEPIEGIPDDSEFTPRYQNEFEDNTPLEKSENPHITSIENDMIELGTEPTKETRKTLELLCEVTELRKTRERLNNE